MYTMYMVLTASTVHAHLLTVPRKPAAKYVDRAGGDRYDLEDSGLLPKYTNKKVQYTLCPGLCVCMERLATSLFLPLPLSPPLPLSGIWQGAGLPGAAEAGDGGGSDRVRPIRGGEPAQRPYGAGVARGEVGVFAFEDI